jgi:hypothetical protein
LNHTLVLHPFPSRYPSSRREAMDREREEQERARRGGRYPFRVNDQGLFEIVKRPSCEMTILMAPFPFLCLGCCFSSTKRITFDDKKLEIRIRSNPGYCCCLRSTQIVSYNDVANMAAVRANMTINKRPCYKIAIITRIEPTFSLVRKVNSLNRWRWISKSSIASSSGEPIRTRIKLQNRSLYACSIQVQNRMIIWDPMITLKIFIFF